MFRQRAFSSSRSVCGETGSKRSGKVNFVNLHESESVDKIASSTTKNEQIKKSQKRIKSEKLKWKFVQIKQNLKSREQIN